LSHSFFLGRGYIGATTNKTKQTNLCLGNQEMMENIFKCAFSFRMDLSIIGKTVDQFSDILWS